MKTRPESCARRAICWIDVVTSQSLGRSFLVRWYARLFELRHYLRSGKALERIVASVSGVTPSGPRIAPIRATPWRGSSQTTHEDRSDVVLEYPRRYTA